MKNFILPFIGLTLVCCGTPSPRVEKESDKSQVGDYSQEDARRDDQRRQDRLADQRRQDIQRQGRLSQNRRQDQERYRRQQEDIQNDTRSREIRQEEEQSQENRLTPDNK